MALIDPLAARLRPLAPARLAAPVGRGVRTAVERRRIGNLSADRGLDVLTFFLADVQTGFGPFIAVYLTASSWSAETVGAVLGIGSVVTMAAQVPAGALIDASPLKRGATLVGLLAVMACAVLLALFPRYWPVAWAETLHGVASAVLVPAVAAVTLSRVGRGGFSERLGRNARCMALGNGFAAVVMGLAGAYLSAAAPFWIAAAFTVPAVLALLALPPRHETEPRPERMKARAAAGEGWRVLRDKRLLVFVLCVALFFVANGFQLALAMTRLAGKIPARQTNTVLAACLLVAQLMVAVVGPWMGRRAQNWGRKRVLLIGFATVPVHAVLLALFGGSVWAVIALELLDGMGGAMYGVLQPLVAADVTKGTNRFNLVLGVLGLAAGLGASASAWCGGFIATHLGYQAAFGTLAVFGILAVAVLWFFMPETKAPADAGPESDHAQPAEATPEPAA